MKKIAYILIGCVCAIGLTYSYFAFADQGTGTESSKEMTGVLAEIPGAQTKLKFTNEMGPQELTIASSVWVYRDQQKAVLPDLKVGDKLEIIANSKKQAAYIKAYSPGSPLPEGQIATLPQPTVSPSVAVAPSPSVRETVQNPPVTPSTIAGKDALKTGAALSPEKTGSASMDGTWEKLSMKANTAELNVEIKQGNGVSEVNLLTMRHEKIMIRGASAEQLIQKLMAGISLKSPTAKQDVLNRIIQEFNLSGKKADLQLDVKWAPDQGQGIQQQQKAQGGQEKDKNKDNKDNKDKQEKRKEQ
jgi:hypothetical protein